MLAYLVRSLLTQPSLRLKIMHLISCSYRPASVLMKWIMNKTSMMTKFHLVIKLLSTVLLAFQYSLNHQVMVK